MAFVQLVRERFKASGRHALDAVPELDEEAILQANAEYFANILGLDADGLEVSCLLSLFRYYGSIHTTVPSRYTIPRSQTIRR